ncbi:MAG: N-6 DNA methylase [Thermoguttaceae bacterium]|nr:N-6 DNA methylase [Thermoguttaceae bacterium]
MLRDSTFVRRQAYVEFDLPAILEEQRFQDFAALYRLLHRTRLPRGAADADQCLLEKYYQLSIEQGGRVREHLRDGVEQCITLLANGFLRHPANDELRRRASPACTGNERIAAEGLYRQLLVLVYRFLFLLVSEDRGLLSSNPLYREHYGIARLRRLLDHRAAFTDQDDLWQSLRVLWLVLIKDQPQPALNNQPMAAALGLPVLNGELFSPLDLDVFSISNNDLLQAFWRLAWYQDRPSQPPRRVNYAALDVEELGSVYESLLELHPALQCDAAGRPSFKLILGAGRKETGSYYTPPPLVGELIQSALEPVIRDRLAAATSPLPSGEGQGVRAQQAREKALLSIRVIDPACGSGHFLLAAARRLGKELARVRAGEEEPAPERVREAIRDVVSHCIYGVDRNPLAVDLCRVALWLESHTGDKPLTFLDHRIRCGDSLVGVFDLAVLKQGIPDKAFDPVTGDDKPFARAMAKRNREERAGQRDLLGWNAHGAVSEFTRHSREVDAIADDSPEAIRRKRQLFEESQADPAWRRQRQACDLWTAAFFQQLTPDAQVITTAALAEHLAGRPIDPRVLARAEAIAARQRFFHWPLEFPEILAAGGFDVVLSNPPWERIKLQEQEFFGARDPEIAAAPNKAARARLIAALQQSNPPLYTHFAAAVHDAECLSKSLRQSGRFPFTATGDINTYAVFAETIRSLISPTGRAGIIVPTGIATDDTTKRFFSDLVRWNQLSSLLGFENEEFIFPAIHHSTKFCALTLSGQNVAAEWATLVFLIRNFAQLRDERRRFVLSPEQFVLLNPNTRTCPVFRTRTDSELTTKLYRRVPVLVREGAPDGNPWDVRIMRVFDMNKKEVVGNCHSGPTPPAPLGWWPMREAKMMWQFDHRFGTYEGATQAHLNLGNLPQTTAEQKADPSFCVRPRYWVSEVDVLNRLAPPTNEEVDALARGLLQPAELIQRQRDRVPKWLLGFRDITSAITSRSCIATCLPLSGTDFTIRVLLSSQPADMQLVLLGNLNSLVFDYLVRQKLGGMHLSDYITWQLPVLAPSSYRPVDVLFVASRVLELVYTANDLSSLAIAIRDSDSPLSSCVPSGPYRWDESRRAGLRAELDAWFARAYGLTRDELRYILDPKDVYGPDFPSETFRVLREKEEKQFGEYRTRRLVLEAWDRLPPP